MTRAAVADGSPCQRLPQNRAGYWADSFRSDGRKSGSQIYHIPTDASVSQVVALLKAYAEDDLQKMVAMGEAESVTVDARYGGAGTVRLLVKIMVDGQNIDVPFAAAGDGGVWKIGPA